MPRLFVTSELPAATEEIEVKGFVQLLFVVAVDDDGDGLGRSPISVDRQR
jgi:hypothetical protein